MLHVLFFLNYYIGSKVLFVMPGGNSYMDIGYKKFSYKQYSEVNFPIA